jgi:16S rRNA (guanine966-N2)-methyltransferase
VSPFVAFGIDAALIFWLHRLQILKHLPSKMTRTMGKKDGNHSKEAGAGIVAKIRGRQGSKEIRITGGAFRGRRLKAGPDVRPTPAMVREALFQMLGGWIEGVRALDLYAGAGSVSLEAIGRGAQSAVLVDKTRSSILKLKANIELLGVGDRVQIVQQDAIAALKSGRLDGEGFQFVFLGPPYNKDLCLPTLERINPDMLDAENSLVVVQASPQEKLPETAGCLVRAKVKTYGDSVMHFYQLPD